MNDGDRAYCVEFERMIAKAFSVLIAKHGYTLSFLKRQGRYASECTFGLTCVGMPKFQVGGETGPYVAVAPHDEEFSLEAEGGASGAWIFTESLDRYLSGSGLSPSIGLSQDWAQDLEAQANTVTRLMPEILNIFSSQESLQKWRPEYDRAMDEAVQKYLEKLRGA